MSTEGFHPLAGNLPTRRVQDTLKQLIVFDLDGTLAESKAALDAEMASLLTILLGIVKVAIISGGDWPQFETQVLSKLSHAQALSNLSLLPTSGTKFYQYAGGWRQLYAENFSDDERSKILGALTQALASSGYEVKHSWGEVTEDRGTQITFSALGQQAPLEEKQLWDPDFAKRKRIKAKLDPLLPEFSVNLGGSTSIDITRPGIDKAYGIRKLRDIIHIGIADMIYLGDAIFPGGNDYPAKQAGALCIRVRDPSETKRVIESIIACLSDLKLPTPCDQLAQ
jgi:HAD superfamily hydrolase (TIGR01484 family)